VSHRASLVANRQVASGGKETAKKKIPDVTAATTEPAPIRSSERKTHWMLFTLAKYALSVRLKA
jgi:hypothetical protein